jgi:hypothetical protein
MRVTNQQCFKVVLLALTLAVAACTGNEVDDGDGSDVILTIQQLTIPPTTGAQDSVTGDCTFTVTDSTASLESRAKSAVVGDSALQAVVMESVTITYAWDDGLPFAPQTFGVGGTVPVNGTASVRFPAFAAGPLTAAGSNPITKRDGHTASLTLVFRGQTVSGDPVEARAGAAATVNSCAPDTDSDGIPNVVDNCPTISNPTQSDCNQNGLGDACDTTPCSGP